MQRVDTQTYCLHPLLREFFANQWAEADQPGWQLAWATALSQQAATLPRAITWATARTHRPLEPHLAAARTWWQSQRTSLPQAKQRANDLDVVLFRLKEPVLFERTLAHACAAHDQARAYGAQGHLQLANQCFAEAEAGYRKAIDQARQALPAHSLQLAGYLRKLANLLRELGCYRAGIPPMKEALDIITASAQPVQLAHYLNDLAFLYYHQGEHSEAEPLYARCLEIALQSLEQDHPNTQTFLNNFITCLQAAVAAGQTGELSGHPLTRAVLAMVAGEEGVMGEW